MTSWLIHFLWEMVFKSLRIIDFWNNDNHSWLFQDFCNAFFKESSCSICRNTPDMGQAYVSTGLTHALYRISLFFVERVLSLRRGERDFKIPATWLQISKKVFSQIKRLSRITPRCLVWLDQGIVMVLTVRRLRFVSFLEK